MRGWQLQPGETTLHKVVSLFLKHGGQRTRRNYEDGIAAVTLYKWQLPEGVRARMLQKLQKRVPAAIVKSRDSSEQHVTAGARRSPARAVRIRLYFRLWDVARAAEEEVCKCYVTTAHEEPWVFIRKRESRQAQEEKHLPGATYRRHSRVPSGTINSNKEIHDSREVARHLKCCAESREGMRSARAREGLHPWRFTVQCCWSSGVDHAFIRGKPGHLVVLGQGGSGVQFLFL